MGRGFPTRPVRDEFGPDPKNRRPVRDPEHELDGDVIGRLMFWQLAGMGLVIPRAWVYANLLNPTPAVLDWAFAWDPRRQAAAPTIARVGAGDYRVTLATQYADEDGTVQNIDVGPGPFGVVDSSTFFLLHCYRESANQVRALLRNTSFAAVDDQKALIFIR